ncbi:PQQ-like beta-propeller repeat protein [Stieleria sp. JC731]|uniref:outer membrane protein assembly factor BamB family protein n=1 Tax=Pirellulaceae TaxID=2691357 RepID=UPI001E620E7A|nr:PQQ-binding-like beta-propeller repeat protein [Stieleria sp. JC731]MCC9603277.1 PQQ-like beta-propeller repeat protein [Stieleria sp. JC731]
MNNHAADNVNVPRQWNLETGENIAWKTKIPGRGHSTPIVTPAGIFLTTADDADGTQSVIKVDAQSGQLLDRFVLHRGTLPDRIHPNNSLASPTMAYDGQRLFASFHTDDAIVVTALHPDGRKIWQKKVCDFKPALFQFGYGASPILFDELVIIAAEYDGQDSGIYALDRETGKQVWKVPRPENLNFASVAITEIAGQTQMMIAGADTLSSYDPRDGRLMWSASTTTEAICGTVVWDGRRVLVSGGNPVSGTWCVSADGKAQQLWSNRVKCYEQSLLAINNYVFAIADNGVGYCWRTQDGKEMWKRRLFGGGISASPLLADGNLVVATERGEVFVISAIPDRFDMIAEIKTGDSIFASPVAIGNRLYLRTGVNEGGRRQEYLVAIGK